MAWNGSSEKGKAPALAPKLAHKSPPSKAHGLIALVVIVIAGGLAAWLLMRGGRGEKDVKPTVKTSKIAEVKPQIVTNQVERPVEDVAAKAREKEFQERRERLKKMSPEEKLEYLFEQAKQRPLNTTPSKGRIYSTSLEQTMDWVFSCELGNPPPPLPRMSMADEAHLAEILVMDNPINEEDSERAKESKEMMKLAKKEFRDFIKQGGDPYDFLPYYHGQLVQAHEEYKMARQSVMETVRKDPDIAPEFIKKVNDGLAAKGIKTVQVPKKMLEVFNVEMDD